VQCLSTGVPRKYFFNVPYILRKMRNNEKWCVKNVLFTEMDTGNLKRLRTPALAGRKEGVKKVQQLKKRTKRN
jgi:hypothetical protein